MEGDSIENPRGETYVKWITRREREQMAPAGVLRSRRKLQRLTDQAARNAAALGHRLEGFDVEEDWMAAVTTCQECKLLASVDLTESPYLFGRALKRKCK